MILIVMGVSGSGKTTVGKKLASELSFKFEDADDYHTNDNKLKMQSGTPLNDEDRWPWFDTMKQEMIRWLLKAENVVLACSALKKSYREYLTSDIMPNCLSVCQDDPCSGTESHETKCLVRFIYLKGTKDVIRKNMLSRSGHFMPLSLLETQLSDLQEPTGDEKAITVHIIPDIEQMVKQIISSLVMS